MLRYVFDMINGVSWKGFFPDTKRLKGVLENVHCQFNKIKPLIWLICAALVLPKKASEIENLFID